MPLVMCPNCRKNSEPDAASCAACGWDFNSERDEAYNATVVGWGRALVVVAAVVVYASIRWTGRRPELADYRDVLLYTAIPAAVVWGVLKLAWPRTGRNLWVTALLPATVLTAAVFATRAVRHSGAAAAPPVFADAKALAAMKEVADAGESAAKGADAFRPLQPIARECLSLVRAQPGEIVREMEAAGVAKMLAPAALEDAKRLDASRARIKRLHQRLDEYEAKIRKAAADVAAKVQATNEPAAVKDAFVETVRRTGGDFVRATLEFVAQERRSLETLDETLTLVRSRGGRCAVDAPSGRLAFADPTDQKKYDAHRQQLAHLSGERAKAVARLRDQGRAVQAEIELATLAPPAPHASPSAHASTNDR